MLVAAVALIVLAVAAAWWAGRSAVPAADPATAARTPLPGLLAPAPEPTLAGLESPAPEPGEVVAAPGPLDDRYRFTGLRRGDGEVAGTVEITTEVSELLELEVLAGFYDATGLLVLRPPASHDPPRPRSGRGGLRGEVRAADLSRRRRSRRR